MSRGKAWLASSLALCSTMIGMNTDSHPVYAGEMMNNKKQTWGKEQLAQEVLYQYLNPITAVANGNLGEKKKSTSLVYTVKEGDNLSRITEFYGVSIHDLITLNSLEDPDLLRVGQTLSIPLSTKTILLDTDDTLESLAKKYDTSTELLVFLNPKLKEEEMMYVGQPISVPKKVTVASHNEKRKGATRQKTGKKIYIRPPEGSPSTSFDWPVRGKITSSFGWRYGRLHKGMDIWNSAASSCVIQAAQGGTVVKAGYSGAYGNMVVIAHPGGWETSYAHMSRIKVSRGQVIGAGQMVGYMGRTGDATGYHLHFEVRHNGKLLNPLVVLGK